MEINKKKVFTILYALSIFSLFGVMFVGLYNLTFGRSLLSSPPHLFIETTIFCIVLAGITFLSIILNMFTKDKFFWIEIACASTSLITLIILLIFNGKNMYAASLQLTWFELLSTLAMLLVSRLCGKFLNKKEEKNQVLKNIEVDNKADIIPSQTGYQESTQQTAPIQDKKSNKNFKKSLIAFIVCAILFIGSFGVSLTLCLIPIGTPKVTLQEYDIYYCEYYSDYYSGSNPCWHISFDYSYSVTHNATYEIKFYLYDKDSGIVLTNSTKKEYPSQTGTQLTSSSTFKIYTDDASDSYTTDSFYITFETLNVSNISAPAVTTQNHIGYALTAVYLAFAGFAVYYLVDFIKIKKQQKI